MEVNKKETLRYLGYRGQELDTHMESLIDKTSQELLNTIVPKSVHQEFPCTITNDITIQLGSLVFESKHLAKNLKGCDRAVIFAATIGSSADTLIKRYSIMNLAKASIVQAAGAALIETFCDTLEDSIRLEAQKRNLYLRPRFSPGYGDLALEVQKSIFNVLECSKRIGITLTDSCLMYPSKSVTAIIGLSKFPKNCMKEKCNSCSNAECDYRASSKR